MMLAFILCLSFTLTLLLLTVIFLVALKPTQDMEKLSPFECGFSPKLNSRMNFSLQFFLVTLIFLIFDVELILMFPYLGSLETAPSFGGTFSLMGFIVLLSLGLFWEWSQGMLEWS